MLNAYLGGSTVNIVTANYKHGLRSLLREVLLLEAYGKAHSVKLQMAQISYEASYVGMLEPSKASDILRKRQARIGYLARIANMELYAKEPALLGVTNLLNLYNALQKADIIRDTAVDDDEDEADKEEPQG